MLSIEISPSGRASCRGCKKKIAKGERRFLEERQGQGDWEYRSLWHLECVVKRRYVSASRFLVYPSELPDGLRTRLLSQALLHRCGQHKAIVASVLWTAEDDDGWAHLVCELESGHFAVITDLDSEWQAHIESTREDALAILPEGIFDIAVMTIGGTPAKPNAVSRVLEARRKVRDTKSRAKRKALGNARRAASRAAQERGVPLAELTKGARVRIVGDVRSTRGTSGRGKLATIFWSGYAKESLEKRVGMTGDDGSKYWANATDVEPSKRTNRRTGGKKTIAKSRRSATTTRR